MLMKSRKFLFAGIILAIYLVFVWAQDPEYKELNPYTGNLDATRSDPGINAQWLRLNTTNDPLTGNLEIQKADPESRITDTGDSGYSRITRTDTGGVTKRRAIVAQIAGTENLTAYTEVDPGTPPEYTVVTENKVTVTNLPWNVDAYIYKDYGVDYFTDFTHDFEFQFDSGLNASALLFPWCVSNDVDDVRAWLSAEEGIAFWCIGNGSLRLWELKNNQFTDSGAGTLSPDTLYYGRAVKSGTSMSVSVYSDSGRTTLVDTRNLTLAEDFNYRYHFASQSYNAFGAGRLMTGFTQNHILEASGDAEALIYEAKDGVAAGEKGIVTFGDSASKTILDGRVLNFNIGGAKKGDVSNNGDWTLGGDLEIQKADPELKLTDTGDSNSLRLIRIDTGGVAQVLNTVGKPEPGNSLVFDGSDDSVTITDHADFDFGTGNFSISAWVQTDDTVSVNIHTVIAKFESNGNDGFFIQYQPSTANWFVGWDGTTLLTVATNINDGNFHHILFERTGAQSTEFWVDGVQAGTKADNPNTNLSNGDDVTLGILRTGLTRHWQGRIDEIALWSESMSTNDIADLYDSGLGLKIDKDINWPTDGGSMGTNLSGLWHHDESAMNTAPGGTDTEDFSSNGHHGTAEVSMTDGDFVIGHVINSTLPDVEVSIWKSEDGVLVNERGKLTVGNADSTTIIRGGNVLGTGIRLELDSTEIAQFDSNGTLTIDNGSADSQQLILKTAGSATENVFETRDSADNIQISFDPDGATIFNEEGNDSDFRAESTNETAMLQVDAGNNSVDIGGDTGIIMSEGFASNGGGYLYVGSKSSGAVAGELGFFVAGLGSGTFSDGPALGARGNNFTRIANQHGLAFLSSGIVGTSLGLDGAVLINAGSGPAVFSVGANFDEAMRVEPDRGVELNFNNNVGLTVVPLTINLSSGHSANAFEIKDSNSNVGYQIEPDFDIIQGLGATGKDYTRTINGENNDYLETWDEGNDYLISNDEHLFATSEKQLFRDTEIGIYSQADTFLDLFADGAVRIGDSSAGAPTTYVEIEPDADMTFVGSGSGLPYGNMFIPSGGITVTIAVAATPTEVDDGSSPTWTGGQTNNATFSDHNLSVGKTGRYSISWSMSVALSTVGGNIEIHGGIMIDSVATRDDGEGHRTITGANQSGHISGMTIQNLTVNQEISLWISNATNTNNITVDHGNVVITLIGG